MTPYSLRFCLQTGATMRMLFSMKFMVFALLIGCGGVEASVDAGPPPCFGQDFDPQAVCGAGAVEEVICAGSALPASPSSCTFHGDSDAGGTVWCCTLQ
jgi:hypothetical protein